MLSYKSSVNVRPPLYPAYVRLNTSLSFIGNDAKTNCISFSSATSLSLLLPRISVISFSSFNSASFISYWSAVNITFGEFAYSKSFICAIILSLSSGRNIGSDIITSTGVKLKSFARYLVSPTALFASATTAKRFQLTTPIDCAR